MLNLAAIEVRRFWRAAWQHLEVAETLATIPGQVQSQEAYHAVYVGGYAVECGLKALILSCSPPARHRRVVGDLFRDLGHNLEGCRDHLLGAKGVRMPPAVDDVFRSRVLGRWVVAMRYQPGLESQVKARTFLRAVRSILDWVGGAEWQGRRRRRRTRR